MHRSFVRKLAAMVVLVSLVALSLGIGCAGPTGEPGPPGPPAASPGASLMIMPNPVKVGESFNLVGSGFNPGGVVVLTLVGVEYQKLEFVFEAGEANKYGAFDQKIASAGLGVISKILKPGVYTVEAKDDIGGVATTALVLVAAK